MEAQTNRELFDYYLKMLGSCCLNPVIDPATVDEVHAWEESTDEANGGAVFRIGSSWFAVTEWQDYTGHGCRCGAELSAPFPTKEAAVRFGLTLEIRDHLNVKLEGE